MATPSSQPVALDVGSLRARPAGVGVYVRCLAQALAECSPERVALIGRRPEADVGGAADRLPAQPFRGRHYQTWLQLHAAGAARRAGAALVHYTNAGAPLVGAGRYVLTVHDLSVVRLPGTHPRLRLATLPVTLAAMAQAAALIVPSQAVADEIHRLPGMRGRSVTVVALAAAGAEPSLPAERVLDRLGLRPGGYLVAVGTLEPRKNLVRLIAAFERLVDAGYDLRLVLAGSVGWRAGPILRAIEQSPKRTLIVQPGYLAEDELGALVGASAAACYVSLYEGFGLPVIEAMAAGVPVVTSTAEALVETAGGAAVLVEPTQVESIVGGVEQALARREELAAAGRARAARRTWLDVAKETMAVYDAVLAAG